MKRRVFFATIAAACGLEIVGKLRADMRQQEVAAILRLRDELSAAIRKASEQIKAIREGKTTKMILGG